MKIKDAIETVKGLRNAGLISDITMKDYDKLCLAPIHKLSPKEIKKPREREKISQYIFAALLNTSVSTIQKWEIGKKSPVALH